MTETRDFKILTTTNHQPHVQLREGDRIVGVAFDPYHKFRHSVLRVKIVSPAPPDSDNTWLEREEEWRWVEMPKELADLCRVYMNTQEAIETLLKKMSGVQVDDCDWRCE